MSALAAVLGGVIAIVTANFEPLIVEVIIPIAIGGFIYIAGSDLIPELHKNFTIKKSIIELATFMLGIAVMVALLLIE